MRLNRGLVLAFGEKAYNSKIITNPFRIAPLINKIMRRFIKGDYDKLLEKKKGKIKAPAHTDHSKTGIDKNLRNDFALKACKDSLIGAHTDAYALVEYLMRMYNNSLIDLDGR